MLHSFVQNLRKIVIGTRNLDACGEAWERAGKKMKICEKTREGIVRDTTGYPSKGVRNITQCN